MPTREAGKYARSRSSVPAPRTGTGRNSVESTPGQVEPERSALISCGSMAPDFVLPSTQDEPLRLSEMRGRHVVLLFYTADWSPVCGDQLALFNEILPELQQLNVEVLGISVDGLWSHKAFARSRNLEFPLLSDFEPKGAVSRQYGAYSNDVGAARQALYVLNPDGLVHWNHLSPGNVAPGAGEVLSVLEEMHRSGGSSGRSR